MLSLRIARRYLFAPKSHNAVNIISMVALCGVAVAAMAMVAVMSVFNGFTDLAASRFSALDAPLLGVDAGGRKVVAGADSLAARLEALPGIGAVLPVVEEQGLAIYDNRQMAVTLVGVDSRWNTTVPVGSVIIDGVDMTSVAGDVNATASVGVAARAGMRPDHYKRVGVYVPARHGRYNPANPMGAFRADSLRVTAVYRTDQSELDDDRLVMPLDRLRAMLDYHGGEATALQIFPDEGTGVEQARRAVEREAGGALSVLTRREQHADSFRMIGIEKWISFLMLAFILVIASFNIISTLSLLIIEKEESIAILHALGARRRMVNLIFVIQGWLISIFGGLAGVVAGTALVLAQQWGGFIKLGGDPAQMSISVYPVRLDPLDLVWVMLTVAVVGAVTGLVTLAVKKQ